MLEFVPMKQCQLGKDLHQDIAEEGACEKTMEAEMETELGNVDLTKMDAHHASLLALKLPTSSLDTNTRAFQDDTVAAIVHVPADVTFEPQDVVLGIQGSSMTSTETMNRESSQPVISYQKQTLDDTETEKVQALQPSSLDKAEKDAAKGVQKLKELDIEAKKQHSHEKVNCDKVKINGFKGDEIPDTSMILEAVLSDEDQATPVQDDD